MEQPVNLLTLEFLRWVASRPRTYAETMEAWRSHCPRQTAWEDALIESLIQLEGGGTIGDSRVTLTERGRALLDGGA